MTRITRLVSLLAACFLINSCQSRPKVLVSFNQTPPAVRSAFLAYYGTDAKLDTITRQQAGGQDYYDFSFVDASGKRHSVELNEGGDQINQH